MKAMLSLVVMATMFCAYALAVEPPSYANGPPSYTTNKEAGCYCGSECKCAPGKCPSGCPVGGRTLHMYDGNEYGYACQLAENAKLPMAIFIRKGQTWIVEEGPTELLRTRYVTVNLDVTNTIGKKWADKFEITEGLVITNPGGGLQAFRYEGPSTAPEDRLADLKKFANAGTPREMVLSGSARVPGVQSTSTSLITAPYCSSCQSGACRVR